MCSFSFTSCVCSFLFTRCVYVFFFCSSCVCFNISLTIPARVFLFLYKLCVFKYLFDNPHVCILFSFQDACVPFFTFFFTSSENLNISLTIPRMCVPFSLQATIGRILRRITFVAPASGGKCICIESTGAPLRFIENNCGNHSWKKEIGVFYQKSSWR